MITKKNISFKPWILDDLWKLLGYWDRGGGGFGGTCVYARFVGTHYQQVVGILN